MGGSEVRDAIFFHTRRSFNCDGFFLYLCCLNELKSCKWFFSVRVYP